MDNKADTKPDAGSDNKKSEPPPPQVDPNKGSGKKDSDTGPPSDPNVGKGHEEKKDLQDKCSASACRAEPNMTACIEDFHTGMVFSHIIAVSHNSYNVFISLFKNIICMFLLLSMIVEQIYILQSYSFVLECCVLF